MEGHFFDQGRGPLIFPLHRILGVICEARLMVNADAQKVRGLEIAPEKYELDQLPEVRKFQQRLKKAREVTGLEEPYFRVREQKSTLINLNNYNYLGLNGHPEVVEAATEAAREHGTTVSASRLVGGELSLHRELEAEIADFLGAEAALAMVSGYGTNVSVISFLLGPGDLVLHDAYAHDSAQRGAMASRSKRMQFPHNDLDALESLLEKERGSYRRVLVLVEGLYSMDGDFPDLPRLLEMQERHKFLLMVDEAHSFGVLGKTGRGLAELQNVPRDSNVIWMGTLSKSLASCGGFLAGSERFIQFIKHSLPGFVYSVGLTPPNSAAALAALRILRREPERVTRLQELSAHFRGELLAAGFEIGTCAGEAIFPVFFSDPHQVIEVNERLYAEGVEGSAIIFPAVPRDRSRLRFFLSSSHTKEQLSQVVQLLKKVVGK